MSDFDTPRFVALCTLVGVPMIFGLLLVGPRWSVQIGILAGVFQLLMLEVQD